MKFADLSNAAKVEWLLLDAFSGWSSHDLLHRPTNDICHLDREDQNEYYKQLCTMSESELHDLFNYRIGWREADAFARREREDSFRFFSKPASLADFDFWSRQLLWTVDQAVALSLGRNPDIVNSATLSDPENLCDGSAFAEQYFSRVRIAQTFLAAGQLAETATPGEMLAWLERARLSYPDRLRTLVEGMGHCIADWQSEYTRAAEVLNQAETENQRLEHACKAWEHSYLEAVATLDRLQGELQVAQLERDQLESEVEALRVLPQTSQPAPKGVDPRCHRSALTIIVGLARGKFGYGKDTQSGRSAIKNITSCVEREGLTISEKTVRARLDEADRMLGSSAK